VNATVILSFHKGLNDNDRRWDAEEEPCWNEIVRDLTCDSCRKHVGVKNLLTQTQHQTKQESLRIQNKGW
jgi:hypothetical protein